MKKFLTPYTSKQGVICAQAYVHISNISINDTQAEFTFSVYNNKGSYIAHKEPLETHTYSFVDLGGDSSALVDATYAYMKTLSQFADAEEDI